MGNRLPQTATRVDASTTGNNAIRSTASLPAHEPKFTEKALLSPKTSAAQLTHIAKSLLDATRAARSHPRNRSITFEGVAVGVTISLGSTVRLKHNFGQTHVRYSVVWWVANNGTDACNLQFNPNSTADTLYLTSTTAGTADIEVWAQV